MGWVVNATPGLYFFFFFFFLIYLQDVNTHTSVQDITKLFLVNQFTCITLAVRGGRGATSSGDGRYSSGKNGTKEKTLLQEGMRITALL
jgi:hypothetical protein